MIPMMATQTTNSKSENPRERFLAAGRELGRMAIVN
jgi:hypothetical protein